MGTAVEHMYKEKTGPALAPDPCSQERDQTLVRRKIVKPSALGTVPAVPKQILTSSPK